MKKKIKILHIINNLGIGGAERILVDLLNQLSQDADFEVHLVLLNGGGDLLDELSDKINVKVFNYRIFIPLLGRLDPHFRIGLLNYISRLKPDIIHGHLFKAEDFAKTMGFMTRIPVITTSHDSIVHPGLIGRFLNRYLSKAVAVSKAVAKHLESAYGLPKGKIQVIPNAVDIKRFADCNKEYDKKHPVFLYIGRLVKEKGIEDAIRGLALLRNDYEGVELLVYGREMVNGYQEELEGIIRGQGWGFVHFAGPTIDVPGALRNGDIFILPSKTEGFAISVLEAAAAGKPVIATRTGAIPDIICDGESGVFVDWNSPGQIYEAAKKILDEDRVQEYGDKARQNARRLFSLEMVAEEYKKLYQQVSSS